MLQLLNFNVFEKTILVLNWVRCVFHHLDFSCQPDTGGYAQLETGYRCVIVLCDPWFVLFSFVLNT